MFKQGFYYPHPRLKYSSAATLAGLETTSYISMRTTIIEATLSQFGFAKG